MFGKKPTKDPIGNQRAVAFRLKDPKILEILATRSADELIDEMKTYPEACVNLIINFWKFKKALQRISDQNVVSAMASEVDRFEDTLKKFNFTIEDLTGKPYDSGLLMDFVHFEETEDKSLIKPIISETLRPTIYFKGKVIEHGEIIVRKPPKSDTEE